MAFSSMFSSLQPPQQLQSVLFNVIIFCITIGLLVFIANLETSWTSAATCELNGIIMDCLKLDSHKHFFPKQVQFFESLFQSDSSNSNSCSEKPRLPYEIFV